MSNNNKYPIIESWDNYDDLNLDLLRGIYAYGFEKPSPIQQEAILPIINKHDVIAQAKSVTGKTGCFSIGALKLLNTNEQQLQVLILSPTRELAEQVYKVISVNAVT